MRAPHAEALGGTRPSATWCDPCGAIPRGEWIEFGVQKVQAVMSGDMMNGYLAVHTSPNGPMRISMYRPDAGHIQAISPGMAVLLTVRPDEVVLAHLEARGGKLIFVDEAQYTYDPVALAGVPMELAATSMV